MNARLAWLLAPVLCAATAALGQAPLGTAFTYQGQLKSAGSPANGPLTMQFKLFDALSGGNQVGSTLTFDGNSNPQVAVTNGLFTVQLDFGAIPYTVNQARWLEITVSGTTLSPRQPLTPAPFSLSTRGINVDYPGNVGIGTLLPADILDVNGTVRMTGFRMIFGSGPGKVLTSDGLGFGNWQTNPAAYWSGAGPADIVSANSGNVGIGVPAPSQKLDVNGTIRMTGFQMLPGSGEGRVLTCGLNGIGTWQSPITGSQWTTQGSNISYTAGNVGIGTSSPGQKLSVKGAVQVYIDPDGAGGLQFEDFGTFKRIQSYESSPLTLNPLGNNVGIGTATPANNLSVSGNADFSGSVGIGTTAPAMVLDVKPNDIIGNSTLVVAQMDPANQGTKVSFGYQPVGTTEFVGMRTLVGPGTSGCGNTGDIRFDTWECNTSISREIMRITGKGNVGIGTSAPAQKLHVNGSVQATCGILACSDARFKKNIEPLSNALTLIEKLRPVHFDWKREEFCDHEFAEGRQLGLIAQEVRDVAPEVVQEGSDGYLSVDYGRLTPILAQAIKEQQVENRALRARLEALEQKLSDMIEKNPGGVR